ncbi:hypothetical protein G6F31_017901 [Rhizopus arrhizus]|nr:hypothetical protein G6F31_017901 [Rhizopus arrhizus]
MVGRRDRGGDAVVEAHVVTVGARTLMAALERQRTLAAVGGRHAAVGRGHHLERLAIAHPRAGLVAQRKRLQLRAVLRIVLLVPAVQPVQRTGIGHRGPEVESVRHCRGREIVAAREGAVGLGAAGGQPPPDTGAPSALATSSSIATTRRPCSADTSPRRIALRAHCCGYSVFDAPCARAPMATPCWSRAALDDTRLPSSSSRSSET